MTLHSTGNATPEKREARKLLTAHRPRIEALLGGMQFDGFDIEETRRFGNALIALRDAWADTNRHGLGFSDIETARFNNRLARQGDDR